MNFENLFQNHNKLIQHMKDAGYAESYIRLLKTEINWLQKNGDSVDSYETACQIRQGQTKSPEMQRRYRLEYGILKRFDISNIYPDYRKKDPLIKRGAYHKLNAEFMEVSDCYAAN